MATLAYSIEVEGLEDETLVVRGFHGQESLSNSVFLGQALLRVSLRSAIGESGIQSDCRPDGR